jgi:bifunctional non-homologous end joining protein LigD
MVTSLSRRAACLPASVRYAPQRELPEFIPPELATLVARPPTGERWIHEIKFDGYRTAARLNDGRAAMLTRHGLDWTTKFKRIVDAISALRAKTAYIDGEIVVLDESGVSSFGGLQEALSQGRPDRLVYYVFDLLHLDGRDLQDVPLVDRKEALRDLLSHFDPDRVRYSEHHGSQGLEFSRHACQLRLEGMVSKRADAPYRSGRSLDWLKTKCVQRQEFVVGGWRPSTAPGRELGSILVGYYDRGKLRYAGKVGTGFGLQEGREIVRRLRRHERRQSPFGEQVPRADARDARWLDPVDVAEVEFTAWTRDRRVRHPSFKGIREDKEAREVTIERPADR